MKNFKKHIQNARNAFDKLYANRFYRPLIDVSLFAVLIFSFHFLYNAWVNVNFYPFRAQVDWLFREDSALLFDQSCWILRHIFGIDIVTYEQTIHILSNQNQITYVEVAPGCTSLKQWMHWLFLMLLFPGPWKHKLWYIPLGLVVIQFVNVIRIVGLSLLLIPYPNSFEFLHNYIFKTFFYFMIFLMWLVWVECFVHRKKGSHAL